ncbi:MAG: N-acetylmuramoyl-L-alanine amidase [Clostridia bacterium]|nr:N-acetylmuramoyl-L-alanine amidase [Clostridia bacterium]
MKLIATKKAKHKITLVLTLSAAFIISYLFAFFYAKTATDTYSKVFSSDICVVIDAGHGGFDSGTVGADGITLEKDINLDIANRVNAMLTAFGINTVTVREVDKSVESDSTLKHKSAKISDIKNRLALAESTDNSVLLSIHQNHYSDPDINGAQVFYSSNNPSSAVLAQQIQDSIVNLVQPENKRSIKESTSSIYILDKASVPAVMVECGFLSNYNELQQLKSKDYRKKIAFSIVIGVLEYLKQTEEV